MYKKKYQKYKQKYIALRLQNGGKFAYDETSIMILINNKSAEANKKAYNLLTKISSLGIDHKIATAESLTGGLIFSTLVDVPFGGKYKYGCFGVYDSDAKRIFLGVKTNNVYTHSCARDMAVGVLRNSNATIAIAVTGNAMATPDHKNRIGEVFISVAGYSKEGGVYEILVNNSSHNFCDDIYKTCKLWYDETNQEPTSYAPLQITSLISKYIRLATVAKAFENAVDFIEKNNLVVPEFINNQRMETVNQTGIKKDKNNFINQKSKDTLNALLTNRNQDANCISGKLCEDMIRQYKSEFTPRG
jgi:PncC family amidohydrolase